MKDKLIIAGREFDSRLLLGTGKFSSTQMLRDVLAVAGVDIVTVALRRADLRNPEDDFLSTINPKDYLFLPNTSGARTAEEAVRIARLGKETGVSDWVKLELTSDPHHLLPDPIETLKAAEILVREGFKVLPYINADPILAKRLEEVGTVAVMPLAAPIGTNKGLVSRDQIAIIIENARVPVIVDAGLGAPSHAAEAMEMGADAVLVNTAIATSLDPVLSVQAFALAVKAGRMGYLSGLPGVSQVAAASSPLTGFLHA